MGPPNEAAVVTLDDHKLTLQMSTRGALAHDGGDVRRR